MIFEKQILNRYKAVAFARCDDRGTAHYFGVDDFPGLRLEAIPFFSSRGDLLRGYLYNYDGFAPDRMVVFDHGFGGGHRSYMKEIEKLCRHGYRVFAYDHTGCMTSEGEGARGLAQSLSDLYDAMGFLRKEPRFAAQKLSVVGHSWGGFSTMNISRFYPDIAHLVVISGYVTVEKMVETLLPGFLKPYRKAVMALERKTNPRFADCDGVNALRETEAQVLLLYSENDPMCKKTPHYDTLCSALKGRENIRFRLEKEKGHNPNYTRDAVSYLGEYTKQVSKARKKKQLETQEARTGFTSRFDWDRMTRQDEDVWSMIWGVLDD